MFIKFIGGRVFIDPAQGCASKCSFCYIEGFGHTQLTISPHSGKELVSILVNHPNFVRGKNGTIISFSPDTEAFDKRVIDKTIEYISAIAPLNNPMQIPTRRKIDLSLAQNIASCLQYNGQIVIFVSNSTISYHHWFEVGTTKPDVRFQTFESCNLAGLTSCLYIKPVIPYITQLDKDKYLDVIEDYNIQYCCIGAFYGNDEILDNVNRVLQQLNHSLIGERGGKRVFALDKNMKQVQAMNALISFVEEIRISSARIHLTSTCVIADSLGIVSPNAIWETTPEVCVGCQDCEGMSKSNPPAIWIAENR